MNEFQNCHIFPGSWGIFVMSGVSQACVFLFCSCIFHASLCSYLVFTLVFFESALSIRTTQFSVKCRGQNVQSLALQKIKVVQQISTLLWLSVTMKSLIENCATLLFFCFLHRGTRLLIFLPLYFLGSLIKKNFIYWGATDG